jgi:hypothetical protein
MSEKDIPKTEVPFTFTRRPRPIPPDLRPDWRLSVLLLTLYYSRGHKVSIKKLNLINWAIRSSEKRKILLDQLENKNSFHRIIVRIEPGISRAVDLAKGYGWIKKEYGTTTRIKLTSKGEDQAKKIDRFRDCFTEERDFLIKIKPFVNEKDIDALYVGGE